MLKNWVSYHTADGISFFFVSPGTFDTAFHADKSAEVKARISTGIPMGRFGRAGDAHQPLCSSPRTPVRAISPGSRSGSTADSICPELSGQRVSLICQSYVKRPFALSLSKGGRASTSSARTVYEFHRAVSLEPASLAEERDHGCSLVVRD